MLLNQLDYQNLDFNTSSRGVGLQFNNKNRALNIIMGDTSNRESTTTLGGYNPRVPNYFVDQFIYGADITLDVAKSNVGASFLGHILIFIIPLSGDEYWKSDAL